MVTDAFQAGLAALEARAETGEVLVIMRAETLWGRMPPRLVADALTLDDFAVRHVLDRLPVSLTNSRRLRASHWSSHECAEHAALGARIPPCMCARAPESRRS